METVHFAENVESVGGAAAGVRPEAKESKNAAVNTEPVGCAFCGSRNYIQIIHPQANCHRGFCAGSVRRCKASAGVCDDRFSVHEPIFSSPPLFQPLIQNRLVPSNVFYSNLNLPHSSENNFHGIETGIHDGLETNKISKQPPQCFMFYPQGDSHGISTRSGEEGRKDEGVSRKHSGNAAEATVSPFASQVCSCSNMIPWTCSPYIVPMVSYIVSWNPVYPNKKLQPPNEIPFTKEEKTDKAKGDTEQAVNMSNNRKKREEKSDDCWTREKSDKFDWKTMYELKGSSTSFVSIGSLECGDDSFPLCDKTKGEADTKDLGFQELNRKFSNQETQEAVNDSETHSVAQSEENQVVHSGSAHDSIIDSAKVSSASSTTIQSETESSPSNTDVPNNKDADDAEESLSSIQKLEEELQEPKTKDRPAKKPIKNFTMAEEGEPDVEDNSNECLSNRIAAAGDVVDNLSDSIEASRNQSITSELDSKESKEDVIRDPEAGENLPAPKKEPNKKKATGIKCPTTGKVGISKLSAIAKPKNPILTPDSSSVLVKRKHNCVTPKATTNVSEPAAPKNQRTKLRTAVQSKGFENLKLKMAATVSMREDEAKRRADVVKGLRQSVALEKEAVKTCLKTRK